MDYDEKLDLPETPPSELQLIEPAKTEPSEIETFLDDIEIWREGLEG